MEPKASVIVPTYNEAENIRILVPWLDDVFSRAGLRYEVVVVDDNSPDGTAEVAERLAGEGYPVRVLVRPGKMGLGTAVVEGARIARAPVIVVMDADLQHPPPYAPLLAAKVLAGEADVAIGSRYVRGGSTPGWGLYRLLVSRLSVLAARILIPHIRHVRDPGAGFFATRRKLFLACIERGKPSGFKLLLEYLAVCPGLRVAEIPIQFMPRQRGASKAGPMEAYLMLKQLLRHSLRRPS